ncbi:MAG: mannose-1-phosphate guanylyltransferase [Chitinophagales bacterium]
MKQVYVVIMAGGIGSRFWPKSRTAKPKQFLDILGTGNTLLQMTYERFAPICEPENIFMVTIDEYRALVQEQLPHLGEEQILEEPIRRNTAPCIAYACDKIYARDPDARIIVVPSDHLILYEDKFLATIKKCLDFVEKNEALVTLGIKPMRPSTGYGYIQFDEDTANGEFFRVKTFTEKPDLEIAKTFFKSGDFLWNSGMFVWKAKDILSALHQYLPEVMDCFAGGAAVYNQPAEKNFVEKAYSQCTNISIDYGVMEKAANVFTIPSNFGWSDIGSWDSLYEVYKKDYLGNAVMGDHVKMYDAANNMVMVPNGKLVVLQGIEGYCVIDTHDVLLICEKTKEQEIKQITIDLKKEELDRYL